MGYSHAMKRFSLLALMAFGLMMAAPAQAQNKIIILKKDGSREEIIIDQPAVPEVQKPSAPTVKKIPGPKTMSAKELMEAAPVVETVEEVAKPQAPKPKPVVKPAPAKKKAAPKKAVKAKAKKVTPKKPVTPVPPPKPDEEGIARAKAARPLIDHIDPRNIPPGTVITRDLATRAALEVAPPSRGFDVFGTTYKDRPAFQVRFKTENGPHDVIVDGETGKILKK